MMRCDLVEAKKEERGAVLVMLAVFLVAVVSFLALVIDGSRFATASTEKRMTAETAVTAALEAFRNHDPVAIDEEGIYEERLEAAFTRAEEVIAFERNSLVVRRDQSQLGATPQKLMDGSGVLSARGEDKIGVLTPGRWFEDAPGDDCGAYPDTVSECPCLDGNWNGACFAPNDATDTLLTAFDITLSSDDDSPLPLIFKPLMDKMLGFTDSGSVQLSARARATLQPRVGIYGIDLSPSISYDTHKEYNGLPPADPDNNAGVAADYVYELDSSDPDSICSGVHTNPCLGAVADPFDQSQPDGCKFLISDQYTTYYSLPAAPADLAAARPAIQHHREDYACYEIDGAHYLIDVTVHALPGGGTYYGPQPLSDILTGLNAAIDEIETRTVPGDMLGLFGFDSEVLAARAVGPTNQFLDPSEWQTLKDITDVTLLDGTAANAHLLKRLVDYQLFPKPRAQTDIPSAVLYAGKMFPPDLGRADMQVTFFSDFVNTCDHRWDWIDDDGGDTVLGPQRCQTPDATYDTTVRNHHSSWRVFLRGMEEALMLITDSELAPIQWGWEGDRINQMDDVSWEIFSKKGIRFNSFIFGDLVEPHKMLRQSKTDPTKCMDDADARRHNRTYVASYDYVYWRPYDSQRCIFYNQVDSDCKALSVALYPHAMSALTGGYFLPIQPPCDPAQITAQAELADWTLDQASCRDGALEDKLDQAVCAPWARDGARERVPDPAIGTYGSDPVKSLVNGLINAGVVKTSWDSAWYGNNPIDYGMWDMDHNRPGELSGRTVCDTQCRSMEQQIIDVIRKIYNTNPYSLVRDDL